MIVVYTPLLVACLITSSLTIDAFHHWYDCLAGAVIGTINAVGAYRMTYAAIFDWRYNHIPLPRDSDQEHEIPGYGNFGGFEKAVFTRKAGWGSEKGYGSFEQRNPSTHITVPRIAEERV
uniref:Phosphatidic acid phosphatase type 2/haloperoxidase domain-containing protein n=2 Tax=Panagrolaimus TaxID=55784 RepID=A0A914QP02_9BILA